MFYQWGRKDPFTPSTATSPANYTPGGKDTQLYNAAGTPINTNTYGIGGEWINSTAKASNITVLTSKPSTYYGTNGDIITTPAGASWWNPTVKTLYDPCPAGYRVPPNGTFNGFPIPSWGVNINNGMIWKDGFFPASGQRYLSTGQFYVVGSHGYTWMSTPYSATYAYLLAFYSGVVLPNYAYYRSYGFPVRCIIE